MKENAQTSKRYQRGFEPGLSRLRVRHSTTEPPRSTNRGGFVSVAISGGSFIILTGLMALAYFCDISSLLYNKVCVQVNLLSATYCLLPSMVFHSTIQFSKYVSSRIFALFLCHLEKYNYNRHSTTEYNNTAYNCSSNMPTNDNHSKTAIYNYF